MPATTTALVTTLPVSSNDDLTTTQVQLFELQQRRRRSLEAAQVKEEADKLRNKQKMKSKYQRRSFFRTSVTGDEEDYEANSRTSF